MTHSAGWRGRRLKLGSPIYSGILFQENNKGSTKVLRKKKFKIDLMLKILKVIPSTP